ncbi:MAG TPA: NADH-quinone oxidoreductase subunit J [Tepidisphaeraceae bacterium]|nr:NADH-quinone oxidoreductase subunit J [Tepidisphaeraceae bacterium]
MLALVSSLGLPVLAQSAPLLNPVVILVLCVIAGLGTVMLLPGHREMAFRQIGGVILLAAGLIFFALMVRYFVGLTKTSSVAVYFWIFATIAVFGALRVITHPRPVYSALYFVLTVFASAGLFILLEAEFMAAALVLIYAGAILVTYVFVIMLASQAVSPESQTPAQQLAEYDNVSREPLAASAIGFALMGVLLYVIFDRAGDLVTPSGARPLPDAVPVVGATQELGMFLFRNQLVQLELAGLLLTVAMVGAIVIARRQVLVPDIEQPIGLKSKPDVVIGPATPVDDNPHSIPVYGTENPRQKAYPET